MMNEKGNQMLSWNDLSNKEQLAATHYDFYKDVHGVRPRWMNYDEMSEADLISELDNLSIQAERQAKEDAIREEAATHDFEMRVQMLMSAGAKTREQALRWIHEAEGSDGDSEYLCFLVGLPYGYFRESV